MALDGDKATGFSAYCLEVPGVYATGKTEAVTRKRIMSGIAFHLRWLAKSGEAPDLDSEPPTKTFKVEVEI